jgi:hypothetical protein
MVLHQARGTLQLGEEQGAIAVGLMITGRQIVQTHTVQSVIFAIKGDISLESVGLGSVKMVGRVKLMANGVHGARE